MQCSGEQVEMMIGPVQHQSALPSASHTRIIELQPAVEDFEDLHVEISVVDLSLPMVSYEALSYTWGGIPISSKVIVSQTRAISVTKNLEDALRRFRLAKRPRRLWIDALSINQNDDKEKNHQIPLMGAIFHGAATVLVWLGCDAQVEASLDRLSELGRLALSKKWPIPADDVADMKECISRIINVSWFSRRWIIQEVVFNLDVVLNAGFREMSFLKFMTIVRTLGHEYTEPNKQLESTLSIFGLWEYFNVLEEHKQVDSWQQLGYRDGNGDCYLLHLMRIFSHFGCADARDHIFTIASLAQDISILVPGKPIEESPIFPQLVISYEDSVQETYTQFAEFLLNFGHLHWVLAQASARARRVSDPALPSWVPDWRLKELRRPFWTECRDATMDAVDRDWWNIVSDDGHIRTHELKLENALTYNEYSRTRQGISLPKITRTDRSDHQLKAEFSCVRHWPDPPFAIFKNDEGVEKEYPVEDYYELPAGLFTKHSDESFSLLYVNWKSPGFEASQSDGDARRWINSVFKDIWARVVSPTSQLSIDFSDGDAVRKNETVRKLLEKLDYVVTAGGMFKNHLRSLDEQWFTTKPTTVDILQRILAGVKPPDFSESLYLRLVALTIQERCLITCVIDSAKSQEVDRIVLGLGPAHAMIGDQVTCIHPSKLHFMFDRMHWSRTYLFRRVQQNASAESDQAPHGIEEEGESPTMKFIGDCFLTTNGGSSKFNYEYEGLYQRPPFLQSTGSEWWHKRSTGTAKTTINLI